MKEEMLAVTLAQCAAAALCVFELPLCGEREIESLCSHLSNFRRKIVFEFAHTRNNHGNCRKIASIALILLLLLL